jgi:hypothetical protein
MEGSTSVAGGKSQRCPAVRRDGTPCSAMAGSSGFCVGHDAGAQEARRKGGQSTSRAARAQRLLPARLRPVADRLEQALRQVHDGELDPRLATAMASLAGALVRVLTSGEMEERLRALEAQVKGNASRERTV